jgi:DNA-directed RNA polymerase subunit H
MVKKAESKEKEDHVDLFKSNLVPKHELMSGEEIDTLLKQYNIKLKNLPRIKTDDPVVKVLAGKKGDVIKISRNSPTAGDSTYYRVIV